jgi:hypothetical protein
LMRPSIHEWQTLERDHDSIGEQGWWREDSATEEGGDSNSEKTSARNMSADDEEGEITGRVWRKIGETPIFKRRKRKVNHPARFARHPVPFKPSHRSA